MIRSTIAAAFVLSIAFQVSAAPTPLKYKVLGFPDAPTAGTFNRNLSSEPQNFSPLVGGEYVSRQVYENVTEGLLSINPETLEFEPGLAESYEVSKDFLTYTFFLNKKAYFSDGKPVTAEDVKFSIESVRDPAFKASARMPYYDDIEKVEVIDPHTVRFKMKKKYFKNLEVLASSGFTPILPKHVYGDPNKKFPGAPIFGSGPYKVETYNRGKNIMLVRDKNWWGNDLPHMKSLGKFERMNFRFVTEQNLELEMIKKGQIDYGFNVSSEVFEKKAVGAPFGSEIQKIQAENEIPKNWGFVGWNQKIPMFQDRDTRLALAKLFNRKLLLEKFAFGKSVEAVGPYYYKSEFNPPGLKPVLYAPDEAKALLKKSGWEDKDKNGVLEKTINGTVTPFKFTLLLPNRDAEKYFTIFKEDLKKAGIDMEIKLVEWNTFSKLLNEQKFEAVTLAWAGGSPEDDLKQIWHSESARSGGSNFVSYSNKEVDRLIDAAREEMDRGKRRELWRKAAKLIADDAPYAFMFNPKFNLSLVNKKLAFDKPTYRYDFSHGYWKLAAPK